MNVFYERLTELSEKSGKSKNYIERELGYPRNALNNYKNGREPSGSRLLELAAYFNVSPEYLIGKSNEPYYSSSKIVFSHLTNEEKYRLYLISQKWAEGLINKIQLEK